jgi:photosynthetic reaction center cytochrome c subunit
MKIRGTRALGALVATGALLAATGCEFPPPESVSLGFRGLGMQQVVNPHILADSVEAIAARTPEVSTETAADTEPAPPGTWENVQVLGHLSEAEFNRFMLAMTIWVAQGTGQGCNYCHVVEPGGQVDFVSDDVYTKTVSRKMIEMTQDLNVNWASHVGETGVNCWTCHQGQAVPTNFWFYETPSLANVDRYFVNEGNRQIERYYLDDEGIRVNSRVALSGDTDNPLSTNDARHTLWVMHQMSDALGVNCTYCHTTARPDDWEKSPPARVQALRGVRMVRNTNFEYLLPLQDAWPENRLGPQGDGPKLQCSTCHIGAYIPQYGNAASHATGHLGITRIGFPHQGNGSAVMESADTVAAPAETGAPGSP